MGFHRGHPSSWVAFILFFMLKSVLSGLTKTPKQIRPSEYGQVEGLDLK